LSFCLLSYFALIEYHERLLLAGAGEQIAFPVAEAFAAIDDDRALLDRYLLGDAAASFVSPVALFAYLLVVQGAMQRAGTVPRSARCGELARGVK